MARKVFITQTPMNEKAEEKFRDNGIITFCIKNISSVFSAEQMLILLLENELLNINPK